MGARGPAPKREDQRRRRNKTEPVDRVVPDGQVRGPDLSGEHSTAAVEWYEALRRSGQSVFFEPSDWAYAQHIVCTAIDTYVRKPSAMMLQSINSAMASLLVTEADRRRLRVELEKAEGPSEPAELVAIDSYRKQLGV